MTRVLGSGCRTCQTTADVIAQAAKEVGVKIRPAKVTEIAGIMIHGEMSTPGVVVGGTLVHAGGLSGLDEVRGWIGDYSSRARRASCPWSGDCPEAV